MGAKQQLVDVDGHTVRVSNLDKVMFPETGTTKGEVIEYYRRVAPVLLPLLARRPVTRKRWVDGVGSAEHPKNPFFTKQLEPGAPEWIARAPQEHSTGVKEYPLVESEATLVWLAQMASIELHVPQWRILPNGEQANPDRFVLDLDPGPGVGLSECAHVARIARGILTDMGLDPVPVTSGSKGIHVYAPLPVDARGSGVQSADEIAAVAKELAHVIADEYPEEVTAVMAKAKRGGKVFIDWSQNNAAKTTVSPYSLRGRARPWVATPRTWEELEDSELSQVDFAEVLRRVESDTGALAPYVAKRDPARTPEPFPGFGPLPAAQEPTRFVIQEHHARRLHYDLRIERGGVLESWAVPKGVPQTPKTNHLAIMTEPHPLDYLTFEGTIPKGSYGAGTMSIWDSGTVELDKWTTSEVTGLFRGRGPLGHVRLALIRTDGQGQKSSWLLHRMATQSPTATQPATEMTTARPVAPMLAELGNLAQARALNGWAEVKWDGIRAIGVWQDGSLRLFSRNGTEITSRYPELSDPELPATNAVVDGEIVAFDTRGRPSFTLLQDRMQLTDSRQVSRAASRVPAVYELFDLIMLDGVDLTSRPLSDRRSLLETFDLAGSIRVPAVFDDLDEALRFTQAHHLEGVVVKDSASTYRPGARSGSWLKLKHVRHQEAVIIGMRPGKGGRAQTFGSLLLAVRDSQGGLRYAGRVGTGFTDASLKHLKDCLTPLRIPDAPVEVPETDTHEVVWVGPEVVGEVAFNEWTPSGRFRHPTWRGVRPDKSVWEMESA